MSMKKNKLFLLISLLALGLSSCVMYNGQGKPGANKSSQKQEQSLPVEQTSDAGDVSSVEMPEPPNHNEPENLPDETDVTVYLVFGEYGKYNDEFVTTSIGSPVYLEHAISYPTKVGADLPGKDKVKSSVPNSVFVAWVAYNNDGKLTEYLKAPAIDGKILYASFSGGNGGTHGSSETQPTPPPTPTYEPSSTGALPTSGYGFLFGDNSYMAGAHTDDFDGFSQYLISNKKFVKDQTFQLCDFGNGNATWVINIDAYSFGGTSANSENWKEYLSNDGTKYTVLKDFNVDSIYIKLKMGSDQIYFSPAN